MKAGLRSLAAPPSPAFVSTEQGASGKETSLIVMSGVLGGPVTFPLNISGDAEIEYVAWHYPPSL